MSNQSRGEGEPMLVMAMAFGLIFGVLWLLWKNFKGPILEIMRWLRYGELWVISFFTDKQDACLQWLREVRFGDVLPSARIIELTPACFSPAFIGRLPPEVAVNYYHLTADSMALIERVVTYYDRWILAVILGVFGAYIVYFSPRTQFKTRHTLESFIRVQAKMWPVISPIVNFNPSKASARRLGDPVPDKLPVFAEALSPEEWVAWHRISVTNGIPDREATRRAFLLQLGARWNGVEETPLHFQAMFAACALKGAQKREESDTMLGQLSLAWSPKHGFAPPGDLAHKIRGIVKDPKIGGAAAEVARQHAYRMTAMLEVLRWARSQGGVLAPAQFLWLRGADRALWYPLNNLGRRSFHIEGAGAMAHYMAEKNAKKPLPIPRIDTAIVTLNQYFASSGQPIPPREGDTAKART